MARLQAGAGVSETADRVEGKEAYDVPYCFDESLMGTPFYSGADCYPPRYYQRNAVNRTLEAISGGRNRIFIAIATGTGKTYVTFQIVWRLIWFGMKKVLYLADRNNLVDQSIQQDFRPLEKVIHKRALLKTSESEPARHLFGHKTGKKPRNTIVFLFSFSSRKGKCRFSVSEIRRHFQTAGF